MMIIPIIGMAGSGKTTLATKLVHELNMAGISAAFITAGDVARKLAEYDEETRLALESGGFAPREKMNTAMIEEIQDALTAEYDALVLDGFPRYMQQFDQLTAAVAGHKMLTFYLGCNDETSRVRLLGRERSDDTAESIKERLTGFWAETWPMVNWMTSFSGCVHIPMGDKWYQFSQVWTHITRFRTGPHA